MKTYNNKFQTATLYVQSPTPKDNLAKDQLSGTLTHIEQTYRIRLQHAKNQRFKNFMYNMPSLREILTPDDAHGRKEASHAI